MVKQSNPYFHGYGINVDNELLIFRERLNVMPSERDSLYIVKSSDTIWSIAYDFYNQKVAEPSNYYWAICDANNIAKPFDISHLIGEYIVIPNIDDVINAQNNVRTRYSRDYGIGIIIDDNNYRDNINEMLENI